MNKFRIFNYGCGVFNPTMNTIIGRAIYWTPSNIPTSIWFDAYDDTTIDDTAGTVTAWRDKSGNNRHLDNIGGTPTTGVNIMNDKNVITLDGSGDMLYTTGIPTWINGTAYTLFCVHKCGTTSGQDFICSTTGSPVGTDKNLHLGWDSSTQWKHAQYADDELYHGISRTTGPALIVSQYKSSGSEIFLYDSNGDHTDSDTEPSNDMALTNGAFQLGSSYNDTGDFDGDIAELVITTGGITVDTRQKMEGYLAWKWALVGDLPESHPYKYAQPTV